MSAATTPAALTAKSAPRFDVWLTVGDGDAVIGEGVSVAHIGSVLIPDVAAKALHGEFEVSEIYIEIVEWEGRTMAENEREYLYWAVAHTGADGSVRWSFRRDERGSAFEVTGIVFVVEDPEGAMPS